MALVQARCAHCGLQPWLEASQVNRAARRGLNTYCDRDCSGLGRRAPPCSDADKRAAKADYDRKYRERDPERQKARHAAYYQRTRDPAKEAVKHKQRMHLHVEYCRRPEYKDWKVDYDRKYRASKQFGPFGEAAIILNDLCSEIASRSTFTERATDKGTLNKRNTRRRDYERQTDRR